MSARLTRRALCLYAAALPALLAGCAAVPQDARIWRGRFSLRTVRGGKAENQTGRFELMRSAKLLRLDLLTPLSGILARIEITPESASLQRSLDEPAVTRPDADTLLTELLGFTLPVEALADLLDAPAEQNDAARGPWQARILSRSADGTPQRLRIEGRPADAAVSLTVFVENP